MEISQFTTLYLGWEKTCSVFFIAVGVVGIAAGILFWQKAGHEILRWAPYPLAVFGTLSLIVGCTIFFRTDAQLSSLLSLAHSIPSTFFQQEIERMARVNRNWSIYKWGELFVIVASLTVIMAYIDRSSLLLLAIAAMLIATPILALDVIGERNGIWYVEQLNTARSSQSTY
jgi:hypothetical protein